MQFSVKENDRKRLAHTFFSQEKIELSWKTTGSGGIKMSSLDILDRFQMGLGGGSAITRGSSDLTVSNTNI